MESTRLGQTGNHDASKYGVGLSQKKRKFGVDLDLAKDESRLCQLIEAFAMAAHADPDLHLYIAARRSRDARFLLWNEIERLGLEKKVSFTPYYDLCCQFPVFKADCECWLDVASFSEPLDPSIFARGRMRGRSRRVLFVTYMHPWKFEGNSRLMRDWIEAFRSADYKVDLLYYAGDSVRAVSPEMSQAAREVCDYVQTVEIQSPLVGSNNNGLNVHVDDWCGPELLEAVDQLVARSAYDVVFVNYAFLSAVFERVPAYSRKLLMTHDRFEDRNRRMLTQGFPEAGWLSLTRNGEALACKRADTVIAIQPEEARYFESLVADPNKVVTISPVIKPTLQSPGLLKAASRLRIGYFGSHNHVNELNFGIFLDAWLNNQTLRDGSELVLAGGICEHLDNFIHPDKLATAAPRLLGNVDPLTDFFSACDIVINPERGGTGLKIKSLETMAHGMPLFCTIAGAVGFDSPSRFHAAPDIQALVDLVAEAVADPKVVEAAGNETQSVYSRYFNRNQNAVAALIGKDQTRRRENLPDRPLIPPFRGAPLLSVETDGATLAHRFAARLDPRGQRVLVIGSGPDCAAERYFVGAGASKVLSLPYLTNDSPPNEDLSSEIETLFDLTEVPTKADQIPELICRLKRSDETAGSLVKEAFGLAPLLAKDGHACLFAAGDAALSLPSEYRGLGAPVRLACAAISPERDERLTTGEDSVLSEIWMHKPARHTSASLEQDAAAEDHAPSVSILVPFYNVQDYLDACLDSLRAQDYPNFEIILVDDASPDGSRAIAERHAEQDNRILIETHTTNAGLGPARNTGVARASGDYLFFIDSDDVMARPDALRLLVEAARDTGAQLVTGRAERFYDNGKQTHFDAELEERVGAEADVSYSGSEAFLATLGLDGMGYLPMRAWAYLIDASFYRGTGVDFPAGVHEDVGVVPMLCHLANTVRYLPDVILLYRMRDGSISNSPWSEVHAHSFAGVWRHFRECLRRHDLDDLVGAAAMMTARQALWKLQTRRPEPSRLPAILEAVGEILRDADDIRPERIRFEGMEHLSETLDMLEVDEACRVALMAAVAPRSTIAHHRELLGLSDAAREPRQVTSAVSRAASPVDAVLPLPQPEVSAWNRNHARAEALLEQYRAAAPKASRTFPSMLTEGDKAVYYDAGLNYRGDGLIVDGGCFVGGTTHHFVLGLKHNPAFAQDDPRLAQAIKVYDLFRIDDDYILEHLRENFPGRVFASGGSFENTFHDQMAADASYLQVFPGDVMASGYPFEKPVEVLGIDLCKALPVTDYVVRTFFPRLMPGGLVIQQDFIHEFHPHIHLSMLRLDDLFDLDTEMKWGGSVTWRSRAEITNELIAERFGPDAGWFEDRARNVPLLEELCERTFYDENRWIMLLTLGFYHYATNDLAGARAAYDRASRLYSQFEPSEITRRHLAG